MERVFGKDRGSMGRFFRMLQKARLPYLWILAYIAITALLKMCIRDRRTPVSSNYHCDDLHLTCDCLCASQGHADSIQNLDAGRGGVQYLDVYKRQSGDRAIIFTAFFR